MTRSHFQFTLRTLFIAMATIAMFCEVISVAIRRFINPPEVEHVFGGENLTYDAFQARRPDREGLDLRNARQISFKSHSKRSEGWDYWLKMRIAPENYSQLLQQANRRLEQRNDLVALKKAETSDPMIPATWPRRAAPPDWWSLPSSGSNLTCTRWQAQEVSRGQREQLGGYWLYDSATETLWLWGWRNRRQHALNR